MSGKFLPVPNIYKYRKADRTAVKLALEAKGDARVLSEKANRSYVEALFERLSQNIAGLRTSSPENKVYAQQQ